MELIVNAESPETQRPLNKTGSVFCPTRMFEILSTSSMKHEVQARLRGAAPLFRDLAHWTRRARRCREAQQAGDCTSLTSSNIAVIYLKLQHKQEVARHQRNPHVVLVLLFLKWQVCFHDVNAVLSACGLTGAPTQLQLSGRETGPETTQQPIYFKIKDRNYFSVMELNKEWLELQNKHVTFLISTKK